MRRTTLLIICLLSVLVGVGGTAGAAPTSSWTDRSTVDVRLPNSWRIEACEGDAPFLCATNPAGVVAGTLFLSVSDLAPDADTSRAGVEAYAADFHRTFEEDRLTTCGRSYRFQRDPVETADVGGVAGYQFGFTLSDGQGRTSEKVVLHLAHAAGRALVVSTIFTDPNLCPGADHERIEFKVADMPDVLPFIDGVVAGIGLPTDFSSGPACPPVTIQAVRFSDTGGNPHQRLIDCLAGYEVVNGFADGTYRPAEGMTRAHAAAVVGRMLAAMGEELPPPPPNRFADLRGNPHARVINQLVAAGVVQGTSATTFEPARAVTRAEAATLVVRAYELTQRAQLHDAEVSFPDVEGAHAATISRAASNGLVNGRTGGQFEPGDRVRRDEMAAIVGRAVVRMSWLRNIRPAT